MSARKKIIHLTLTIVVCAPLAAIPAAIYNHPANHTLAQDTLAKQLGWVESSDNYCGGYYLDEPFTFPVSVEKADSIEITSNQTLFSQRGTSTLEGQVTVTRAGQQITANKAYLYRDPTTGKLNAMEMIGDVHLREPNSLIVGKLGQYNFETKTKSLRNILYRTTLQNGRQIVGPKIPQEEIQKERKITGLTAWGRAYEFASTQPRVYELSRASFSTCPPINPAWRVKASHIELDKNTGKGYATHARLLVKNIPIAYVPYFSFSIDRQRKSGFLWPIVGGANKTGASLATPFYWNMAPNYDMTITPAGLAKRGVQVSDKFRYLTDTSSGDVYVAILPHDRAFETFQKKSEQYPPVNPQNPTPNMTQAELNRLINYSTTRKSVIWRNDSQFNEHWSSRVDYNYVSDDYYLRDLGNNLNEITQNYLLQEGDLYYKSQNWNFTGRVQAYQTLHLIDEPPVYNQYRRFPQLILNGDYPDQPYGLEYFINNEITHFDIRNTPGISASQPIGNRMHTQPGVSLPLYWPAFLCESTFSNGLNTISTISNLRYQHAWHQKTRGAYF